MRNYSTPQVDYVRFIYSQRLDCGVPDDPSFSYDRKTNHWPIKVLITISYDPSARENVEQSSIRANLDLVQPVPAQVTDRNQRLLSFQVACSHQLIKTRHIKTNIHIVTHIVSWSAQFPYLKL